MKKKPSMKKSVKRFGRQIELQVFALAGVLYLLVFQWFPCSALSWHLSRIN